MGFHSLSHPKTASRGFEKGLPSFNSRCPPSPENVECGPQNCLGRRPELVADLKKGVSFFGCFFLKGRQIGSLRVERGFELARAPGSGFLRFGSRPSAFEALGAAFVCLLPNRLAQVEAVFPSRTSGVPSLKITPHLFEQIGAGSGV